MQAIIHDLDFFDEFLGIINKFVHQCQFVISKKNLNVYCRNPDSFQTSRLLLKTNVMTLNVDESTDIDNCNLCIKDIVALKTAFNMARQIEDINKVEVELEARKSKENPHEMDASKLTFKGPNGYSFTIIATAPEVIKNYISRDSKTELDQDWVFLIDPKKLSLAQNRASNIVKFDEANILLTKDKDSKEGRVLVKFSWKSESVNTLSIPIASRSKGSLEKTKESGNGGYDEVCIHESSFRIFNILSVESEDALRCFFNIKYNTFYLTSKVESNAGYYIVSRLFAQMVKKEKWSGVSKA